MLLKLEQAGVLLAVFLLSCVSALYEDQIKKFDWRLQQIGALHRAHLELNGMQPRLLVSTRENVLASLCPKTGQILWRQILENSPRGDLKLMQVSSAAADMSNTAAARPNSRHGFDMLTVQGSAPAIVRGWNANTGLLEWEWSLMPLRTDRADAAFWVYSNAILYHVLPVWQNHLEITQYFPTTGQTAGTTSKVLAPWLSADKCVLSGVYYVCLDGQRLLSLDLTEDKGMVLTKELASEPSQPLKALEGASGIVIVDNNLVTVKDDIKVCDSLKADNLLVAQYDQRTLAMQTTIVDNTLQIRAVDLSNCEPIAELSQNVPYPAYFGAPTLRTFDCRSLKRSSDGKSCLFVLGTSGDTIVGVQQNKIRWSREEALANVVATEFIDLPLADSEGTLENEMKGGNGDLASAFVRRISAQMVQIKSTLLHVLGLAPPQTDSQKAGLVRDSFGLHKMLVILTESGKVFGVDNISGKIHWQYYLPQISNFAHGEQMRLIVQRTSKHFPLQPLCTIVARSKQSGNGVLYRFNPITGKSAEGGLLELSYKIKQLSLLAESDTDYVKGVLVLSADHQVHVYPENAKKNAHGMYLYTADKSTATLNGFYVSYQQQQLTTLPIWNVRLGGHSGDHQIMAVASKNPIERVHSQGRALSDRSVLYKYINPNLIAVVTQTNDSIHKYILNVYLVDVVSGSVVFSMMHRKVRAPLHIVHSENWLAYSYYNDKVRRTEITTIELYEGKTQANSTVWSSLNAPPMPLVERQTYIIPTVVETMRETITERGITNKHVLIGTSSGAIIEMPWVLLDPRRPISSTTQGREEGAIPYIPELPLPTENIINYNQSIARLHNIYTAPSGLESTCLVVATGLDIFVTRVAPSKTFDLLKEDFDYMLISVVLIALTTGSLVVKHLSSKKILKQAWK